MKGYTPTSSTWGAITGVGEAGRLAEIRGHLNLVQQAIAQRERLPERLQTARGGAALPEELKPPAPSGAAFARGGFGPVRRARDCPRRRSSATVCEGDATPAPPEMEGQGAHK